MSAPRVGVGVFAFKRNGTFILGKRKGSLGSGTFALPGGHLEYGESFTACAARELWEETGIQISEEKIHYLTTVNSVFESEGLHYVTVAVGCLLDDDVEPKVMEPNKCECWQFITWPQLREYAEQDLQASDNDVKMLFKPMVHFVTQRGFDPFKALMSMEEQN
ncbi:uncharacterized protein PV09_05266 [Verruconis gallopava]|uniref:Nudix hydrolase domain-containing protein n=1 Tax=Verruconis gallopava TaxID=253628 RepID=A0A0D2AWK0_9PEZI|nr:uncharacterized protein PV09_05266 [Verruconis gallopava]KIW03499.1 hypothetical protein PV09_05266 [Verruconis gallopava]